MSMRIFLKPRILVSAGILAAGVALVLFVLEPRRPNVLLVVVDTLRADRLSAYGWSEPTSPNVERLAAGGVLVERMLCQVPQTLPSFCSLLTGTHPVSHGVRANGVFALPSGAVTLAEVFRDAGYRTGAFIAGFPLDSSFGLDQGFDTYADTMTSRRPMEGLSRDETGRFAWLGHAAECFENTADAVTGRALKWLRERSPRPFFAMVHYFDPHHDYAPPDSFRAAFRHPYSGEVAFVDQQLGILLDGLERMGAAEETLVVFTADHGECLGEAGRFLHQAHLAEAALHVPCVARWPGVLPAGRRVTGTCRTVDLAPTIVELAGLDALPEVEGHSLAAAFESGSAGDKEVYFETLWGKLEGGTGTIRQGIARGRWKLIRNRSEGTPEAAGGEWLELFDLAADPLETDNLAPRLREKAAEELRALEDFLGHHPAGRPEVLAPDEETLQKLKDLGYF